jgi:hypothetical protein
MIPKLPSVHQRFGRKSIGISKLGKPSSPSNSRASAIKLKQMNYHSVFKLLNLVPMIKRFIKNEK